MSCFDHPELIHTVFWFGQYRFYNCDCAHFPSEILDAPSRALHGDLSEPGSDLGTGSFSQFIIVKTNAHKTSLCLTW